MSLHAIRRVVSTIIMPVTRSSTRAKTTVTNANDALPQVTSATSKVAREKRKLDPKPSQTSEKRLRVTQAAATTNVQEPHEAPPVLGSDNHARAPQDTTSLVPAVLTFSFEEAKKHLISVDHRFEDVFAKMPCKPFEHLERIHPFRALVTSIIGQQISWLAARSVNHKFVRLYDPSLPEKIEDYSDRRLPTSFFPSPEQVAKTDIPTLRTAGLSQRKAEYVLDLAQRFADARLTTEKLINANDEELADLLIQVRGIGRWTVDMFAIFSLRRPDILPVGDLGVQRGLTIWFLSLHSPKHSWGFTPKKVPASSSKQKRTSGSVDKKNRSKATNDSDELPVFAAETTSTSRKPRSETKELTPDVSSVPPTTSLEDTDDKVALMPPAFTPSINKTLNKPGTGDGLAPAPLPAGLTVEMLKARLDGKKKIKGAFLTPKEMEDLTESWRPYRSLGVYYMWSIANVPNE